MQTLIEHARGVPRRRLRWVETGGEHGLGPGARNGHAASRHPRRPMTRWAGTAAKRHAATRWHEEPVRTGVAEFVSFGTPDDKDLERVFARLADQWETETAFESFPTRAVMHPAYLRIMHMGPRVVPLILDRLQEQPRPWFWALSALTKENPAAGTTRFSDAADTWLQWGRENALIE
jgi:hypothetical protein